MHSVVWLLLKIHLEIWLVTLDSKTLENSVIQISPDEHLSKWPNVVVSQITDNDNKKIQALWISSQSYSLLKPDVTFAMLFQQNCAYTTVTYQSS